MIVREHVSLRELTTLHVGGSARYTATIDTPDDVETALAFTRERGLPFVVLGQGSNVLASDDGYPGVVMLMRIPGSTFVGDTVTAAAGGSWDALVSECAAHGLWGLENLAGIPGTVGAAPVQNIGAYGAEVRTVISSVTAYDVGTGTWHTFENAECGFSYRDSRFKHEPNLIITAVTFALSVTSGPHVEYADLIRVRDAGVDLSTPAAIGEAVRAVRAGKFPDLSEFGTAGSFFKNPIVTQEMYDALSEKFREEAAPYGGIPQYPVPGQVKIPLAFILDKILGMRGYRQGPTFLFGNQPLVLVADPSARALDVDLLAREIETRVHAATGIIIEREVRMLDAHQSK
jgi:UDP-N-acetylmuramate dehydrogenase